MSNSATRLLPKPLWIRPVVRAAAAKTPVRRFQSTTSKRALNYIQFFKDQVEEALEYKAVLLQEMLEGRDIMKDTFIRSLPTGEEEGEYAAFVLKPDGVEVYEGALMGQGRIEFRRASETSLDAALDALSQNKKTAQVTNLAVVVETLSIDSTSVKHSRMDDRRHPLYGQDLLSVIQLAVEQRLLPLSPLGVCSDAVASLLCSSYEKRQGVPADIAVLLDPGFNIAIRDENPEFEGRIINSEIRAHVVSEKCLMDLDYLKCFEMGGVDVSLEQIIVHIGDTLRLGIRAVWQEQAPERIRARGQIANAEVLRLANDKTKDFEYVKEFFERTMGWQTTLSDRRMLQSLALGVAQRAAAYFASTIVATISYAQLRHRPKHTAPPSMSLTRASGPAHSASLRSTRAAAALDAKADDLVHITVDTHWDPWWLKFVNHLVSRALTTHADRMIQVTHSVGKGALAFASRSDIFKDE